MNLFETRGGSVGKAFVTMMQNNSSLFEMESEEYTENQTIHCSIGDRNDGSGESIEEAVNLDNDTHSNKGLSDFEKKTFHERAPASKEFLASPHVQEYVSNSATLNHYLINHHKKKLSNKTVASAAKIDGSSQIRGLDKVLDGHKTKEDIQVYSGTTIDVPSLFKGGNKTVKAEHPAYMSTSTDIGTASRFAKPTVSGKGKISEVFHPMRDGSSHSDLDRGMPGEKPSYKHILKIHVPKGSTAASVWKKFSTSSNDPNHYEEEILLHRGHTLEIHHSPSLGPRGSLVWHARVVDRKLAKSTDDVATPLEHYNLGKDFG